jgi:hypothetical protein
MPDIPIAEYAPQPPKHTRRPQNVLGLVACAIATGAILLPLPMIFEMLGSPPGSSMRPMGAVAAIFLGAAMGLFLALPTAIVALILGRRQRRTVLLAIIACLLACTSVVADYSLFNFIVSSRGYVMEP